MAWVHLILSPGRYVVLWYFGQYDTDLTAQEAATFPDWGKMQWKQYAPRPWSELLPKASPEGQDLVSQLVVYESGRRLSAAEVGQKLVQNGLTSH